MNYQLKKHWDETSEENSDEHHTGKCCIENGCYKPAGTAWSPHWCWYHNALRLDRVEKSLSEIDAAMRTGE